MATQLFGLLSIILMVIICSQFMVKFHKLIAVPEWYKLDLNCIQHIIMYVINQIFNLKKHRRRSIKLHYIALAVWKQFRTICSTENIASIPSNEIISKGDIIQKEILSVINIQNVASTPSVICNKYVDPPGEVISTGDIIKKEILSVINEHEFERTKRKVKCLYNCYRFRKYKTKFEGTFGTETWQKGDMITFEELLYLKIFNDHDKLKQKCNHLWCFNYKLLTIISKFGEHKFGINQNHDNMQLYLAPNSQDMVMSRNTPLFVPLSTFGCNEMAELLVEEGETIMKMQPVFSNSCYCRALNASKISDDPDEEEYIIMYIYSNIVDISTWSISVFENKFE